MITKRPARTPWGERVKGLKIGPVLIHWSGVGLFTKEHEERYQAGVTEQERVAGIQERREPQVGAEADRLAAEVGLPALGMEWLGAKQRAAVERGLQMPLAGNGRDEEDPCYARLDELVEENSADLPEALLYTRYRTDILMTRFGAKTGEGEKLLLWRVIWLWQRRKVTEETARREKIAAGMARITAEQSGVARR